MRREQAFEPVTLDDRPRQHLAVLRVQLLTTPHVHVPDVMGAGAGELDDLERAARVHDRDVPGEQVR